MYSPVLIVSGTVESLEEGEGVAANAYTCQVRNGLAGQFVGLVCDMRTVPAIKRRNDHQKKRPTSHRVWKGGGNHARSAVVVGAVRRRCLCCLSACCCLRTNWAFKCNVITFLTPSSVGTSGNRRPLMRCPLCKLAYKLSRVNIKSNDKRVCQNVREAQKEPQSLQLQLQLKAGGRGGPAPGHDVVKNPMYLPCPLSNVSGDH